VEVEVEVEGEVEVEWCWGEGHVSQLVGVKQKEWVLVLVLVHFGKELVRVLLLEVRQKEGESLERVGVSEWEVRDWLVEEAGEG
jgi:hypothetical protein